MKEKITLFILFFSLTIFAQEEYITDYEIWYEVEYSIDSTNLEKRTKEDLYLYSGSQFGVFMNFNEAHEEEIIADYEEQMRKQKGQSTTSYHDKISRVTNFNSIFYKDYKSDTIWTLSTLVYQYFLYPEPITPVWELQDEMKSFENYTVQKATTHFAGRDYTAWFTSAIPIPDGPYLFKGLPGLIVEFYDAEKHYHFKLTSVQKLKTTKAWTIPENHKKTTKKEFLKLKEKEIDLEVEDMFSIKGDEDQVKVVIGDREVSKGEYKKVLKEWSSKKNNHIERN